jgi:hypothetical protein
MVVVFIEFLEGLELLEVLVSNGSIVPLVFVVLIFKSYPE